MKFLNGDFYDGDFENNMIQGRGIMTYKNKTKYIGQFSKGVKHGEGELIISEKKKISWNVDQWKIRL